MENALSKFSILVVDDDRLIQKLIFDVLIKLGFGKIHRVNDAHAALQLLDTIVIDFIITDWRMGSMDGVTFARHVRGSMRPYAAIPIIMLTGNAEKDQVVKARDAGINEYLIKPFTMKELCRRINEVIEHPREYVMTPHYSGPSRRRQNSTAPHNAERRKKRRVSVVKDRDTLWVN
ncbi:MAG: response regulator [Alphaproteobacteria bacterium]|nr:response regulator [Alphaproteobacteria bacterium]MBV8548532.1 response regulator [Alphaproteobacteria bacterium]